MKKALILIIAVAMSLGLMAQSATFLGIPINNTISSFSYELQQNGFTQKLNGDFVGSYLGVDDVEVILIPMQNNSNEVSGVFVTFPSMNSWDEYERLYNRIDRYLGVLYGSPTYISREFDSKIKPTSSKDKYTELQKGNCAYLTSYAQEKSSIDLFMSGTDKDDICRIRIIYTYDPSASPVASTPLERPTVQPTEQSTSHLKFKGIPIDGNAKDMVDKLVKKGYNYEGEINNTYVLTGTFAGYSNCNIFVSAQNYLVSTVGVVFSETTEWLNLYSTYSRLKNALTEKYGKPQKSIENFSTPYEPSDDMEKSLLTMEGKCNYETVYLLPEGMIVLSIARVYSDYMPHCYVSLSYIDKQNYTKEISIGNEDL